MRALVLIALLMLWPAPARAAVEIAFYSRDLEVNFPHAFVTLKGTLDATGEVVDANFGFTPRRISPVVLVGSIGGKVVSVEAPYIALSNRHFAVVLTDDQYRAVMARVDAWRTHRQPSYNLNSRNCVVFVAELAAAAGLDGAPVAGLMKKPRSFLTLLGNRNRVVIARSGLPADAIGAEAAAPAPAGRR
jgi:hypothetical protein